MEYCTDCECDTNGVFSSPLSLRSVYLPVSSMGVCCVRLTATHVLVYLLLSSLLLSSLTYPISVCYLTSTEMNSLPSDVHPDLPRNEFIQKLIHISAAELHRLRLDLFNEANNVHSLVLPELSNVPLVTRKDTAIKPISQNLSEDVWAIVSSISNNAFIPRTLFRNGKRSKEFLTQTSQHPINTTSNTTMPLPQSVPVSHARALPSNNVRRDTPSPDTQCNPPTSKNVTRDTPSHDTQCNPLPSNNVRRDTPSPDTQCNPLTSNNVTRDTPTPDT